MKKQMLLYMAALSFSAVSAQTYETRFARPLSDVLNDVAARFQIRGAPEAARRKTGSLDRCAVQPGFFRAQTIRRCIRSKTPAGAVRPPSAKR